MGKRRSKKGRSAKNAQKGNESLESADLTNAPHTFIIHKGDVGKSVVGLRNDLRRVFEPYTASNLKVMKSNVVKDFVAVAGVLNVTHLLILNQTELSPYLKLCRLPHGPTITYRVDQYSLHRDVVSIMKRPTNYEKLYSHHPFLVLNNFSGEGMHIKLMATMLQNMFPSINVNKVKLNQIRRCVMFNYNPDTCTVDFRHYAIKMVPHGMSRGVKKVVQSKIPNLSRFEDISEFMTKSGMLSDSEAEVDGQHNTVVLPQNIASRGNMVSQKSAIRLIELGPRMTLQLNKIQEGLMNGDVMYDLNELTRPKIPKE